MGTALITGASSGIGEAFAEELAQRGMDVVIVARSKDKLEQLAERLRSQHSIQAEVIVQDLTTPEAATAVYKAVETLGWPIDLLINNAGFGDYGVFCDRPRQKQLDMIQLNISALVDLTHQFLPRMIERQSGSMINVASIAAFQPLPYLSVYAATKAFVLSFSEALWEENRKHNISILAVCPGPTESQFFEAAEFPSALAGGSQKATPAEEVVKEALQALAEKQSNVVTGGISNWLISNVPRLWPRQSLVKGVAKVMQPPATK
ncbi:putative oxidoreductase [Acaryochloris thomasi RCC1774]|uniref:Putative oxidoreductase n=1 Tax=Acaryochloris thomasi RCC1774 TaxID=1764569 RepID=A0A2W1JA41_9CYAN|nr:SDR family oxidoreductase [Acaryochloris thomasi]PZD70878.1 putative oxidoreductase [Acaryochloris thomasi RCC1774]